MTTKSDLELVRKYLISNDNNILVGNLSRSGYDFKFSHVRKEENEYYSKLLISTSMNVYPSIKRQFDIELGLQASTHDPEVFIVIVELSEVTCYFPDLHKLYPLIHQGDIIRVPGKKLILNPPKPEPKYNQDKMGYSPSDQVSNKTVYHLHYNVKPPKAQNHHKCMRIFTSLDEANWHLNTSLRTAQLYQYEEITYRDGVVLYTKGKRLYPNA
jgi:hypothetical protein